MSQSSNDVIPAFFYRFEGLSLVAGNKSAGFTALLSTQLLIRLRHLPIGAEWHARLQAEIQARLANAKLLPKNLIRKGGIVFVDGTWCPLCFMTDPAFGASIGAAPGDVERLLRDDALEWIGPAVAYTAHNTDTPSQALALVIMVETWGEFVRDFLLLEGYPLDC